MQTSEGTKNNDLPCGVQSAPAELFDPEIDVGALFSTIWAKKFWIIGITFIATVISVLVSLSMPNIYRSEALLVPVNDKGSGGLSELASQYGGLASFAGVDLGGLGGSDRLDESIAILKSRKFIVNFIEQYDLLAQLMAVDHWDGATGQLVFDAEIYDVETGQWLRDVEPPRQAMPSDQEAYEAFMRHMSVSVDRGTKFVTLRVEHQSPVVAQQWVSMLVSAINEAVKLDDVANAERSIKYLSDQLSQTSIADLQTVFYQLIEGQMKTIMLANGREEYLFRTIDPAVVSEVKVKPKRLFICLFGAVLGGLLSLLFIFVLHFFQRGDAE